VSEALAGQACSIRIASTLAVPSISSGDMAVQVRRHPFVAGDVAQDDPEPSAGSPAFNSEEGHLSVGA
jgi:hypothetical protein